MDPLKPSDFSSSDFEKNVATLETAMRMGVNEAPREVYDLRCAHEGQALHVPPPLTVASVKGKRVSTALLYYLFFMSKFPRTLLIDPDRQALIDAFFAPLAGAPKGKHPTAEFLQKPGLKMAQLVASEPGAKAYVSWLWDKKQELGNLDEKDKQEFCGRWPEICILVERGVSRLAEPSDDPVKAATKEGWTVHPWLQQAVLLSFHCLPLVAERSSDGKVLGYDKFGSAFAGRSDAELAEFGYRIVSGFRQRECSYVAPGVIGMPGFVNLLVYLGGGSMLDTGATAGSGAQVGKNVHLAGGVGLGGVLEPPGAQPVIICDDVFVGSRVPITEGIFVGPEAVIGAGVTLTASLLIIDVSGKQPVEYRGIVPARSVVIPGVRNKEYPAGEFSIPCALIVGKRNKNTDKKVSLNEALRKFNVSV